MAKTPGTPKKSRSGIPAQAASENKVRSFTDAAAKRSAERSAERMLPAFTQWLTQTGMLAEEMDQISNLLMMFFRNYAASAGVPDATNLDVELATKMLEDAGRFHPEMGMAVSTALSGYLKFLLSMHLWTGAADNLQHLINVASQGVLEPQTQIVASYVLHTGIDPAESAEDRASRKHVRRAVALLEWIGDGRELTATGNVRRKDLAEAAACVDFSAIGSARTLELPAADQPRPVASMDRVPRLPEYWHALLDAQLIKVAGKKVTLTRAGKPYARIRPHLWSRQPCWRTTPTSTRSFPTIEATSGSVPRP